MHRRVKKIIHIYIYIYIHVYPNPNLRLSFERIAVDVGSIIPKVS